MLLAATETSSVDPLWYKDAIIYELHVKTFHDSNGDGIGDFRGLIEKLDYLQELGVTAIWLLPFYPSPLRDDGYDIADYYDVNPNYGTLQDFKAFLESRKIRIDAEAFEADQAFIRAMIHHDIDLVLFGVAEARRNLLRHDPQANFALRQFDEAVRLTELGQTRRTASRPGQ